MSGGGRIRRCFRSVSTLLSTSVTGTATTEGALAWVPLGASIARLRTNERRAAPRGTEVCQHRVAHRILGLAINCAAKRFASLGDEPLRVFRRQLMLSQAATANCSCWR
jgi:hypothetical protein